MAWTSLVHYACDHDEFSRTMLEMQSEFCERDIPEDSEIWQLMNKADAHWSELISTLYTIAGHLDE